MATALDERIEMARANVKEIEIDLARSRGVWNGGENAYTHALENALTDAQVELDSLLVERDAVRTSEREAVRAERDQLRQERRAARNAEKTWKTQSVDSNLPLVIDVPPEDIEFVEPDEVYESEIMPYQAGGELGPTLDAEWEPLDEEDEDVGDYVYDEPIYFDASPTTYSPRSSYSGSNQLAVERERTRRARKIERQRNHRERMRIQAQRDMYNRRLRHERTRMVGRAVGKTAKAAARASKEQKIAQGRTGGKRITNEPGIFEKLGPQEGAANPAAFAGGAVLTGGGLLLGTKGMTVPLLSALVSAGVYFASENETVKDAALGGLVGSGVMTLIRLMNARRN